MGPSVLGLTPPSPSIFATCALPEPCPTCAIPISIFTPHRFYFVLKCACPRCYLTLLIVLSFQFVPQPISITNICILQFCSITGLHMKSHTYCDESSTEDIKPPTKLQYYQSSMCLISRAGLMSKWPPYWVYMYYNLHTFISHKQVNFAYIKTY